MLVLAKIFTHLLFACGMLVFMIMPGNKYEWMQEMDSSIASLPADNSGNRAIFMLLLLAAIIATQLGIISSSSNKREKRTSLALIAAATSVYLWHLFQ